MIKPAALLLVCAAGVASAQAKYTPPRAWDGHADLTGIWEVHNRAWVSVEPRSPSLHMPAAWGVITDPADGMIPYKAGGKAKRDENYKNRATLDTDAKCYMPGVPRLMYMPYPFQIFQSAKHIIIASEYIHVQRTVYMDGSPHLDGVDFWMGDSRGHWEGDTLVVEVTNFNGDTWLDAAGNHHSDKLKVTERYTRTAANMMTYQATIEDPETYTRPWTISMPMYLHEEPNFRILEYECHSYREDAAAEGN